MNFFLRVTVLWAISFSLFSFANRSLINSCVIQNNKVSICANPELVSLFRLSRFYAEYSPTIPLDSLPEAVVTIPFLMNVAPLVWLSGHTYTIEEMDEDLYWAFEKINRVFRLFYPDSAWSGRIQPIKLIKTPSLSTPSVKESRVAVLFSHGLDAMYTTLNNRDKEQLLITICGSDIAPQDTRLWQNVLRRCQQYAASNHYRHEYVRSNFGFIAQMKPINNFYPTIQNWFGQVMQSMAYIGVAAPIAYATGCSSLLIGSTRTIEHPYPYGTHPAIDNLIAFASITIEHDGQDKDRVQKIEAIKTICQENNLSKPFLRVCWGLDKFGGNCGKCEKCTRTLAELLVLNENPNDYGLAVPIDTALHSIATLMKAKQSCSGLQWHWHCIQRKAQELSLQTEPQSAKYQEILNLLATLPLNTSVKVDSSKNIPWHSRPKELFETLWQLSTAHALTLEKLDALIRMQL